jgi:Co/Zn/Cd efflux system component
MRSAWICTRNDVLGNLAVLLAAAGVFGTGTGWPDVTVAAVMAMLALQGAATVIRQAKSELQSVGHRVTPDPLRIRGLRHAGSPVALVEKHR